MTSERRRKGFFEKPLVNTILGGVILFIVLIPINIIVLNFTKISESPEQIQKINYEIKSISEDVNALKTKFDKNDENILRLEKAVTRLEALIERLKK
jgi:peptidoglycan hydrolase CwlO-like protein